MGEIDISAKHYISQKDVFADIFNFKLFQGEQVIRPEDLRETSSEEFGLPYGDGQAVIAVSKMRDLLKQCIIKSTDKAHYVLLGIENQASIHYALPVKLMVYDALNYAAQVTSITKSHRKQKDNMNEDEFLSGMKKDDRILPVITTTLYLGAKEWDGPRNLHEMLDTEDNHILNFTNNYKTNLIIPNEIENFEWFHSNLRYVLEFIKASKDKQAAGKLLETKKDVFSKLDIETAFLISKCTSISIERNMQEGVVDMCKAWEDQKLEGIIEGKLEGRTEGEYTKLIQQVRIKISKGVSPENCAEMLEEKADLIETIYACIENHPEWDNEQIYETVRN